MPECEKLISAENWTLDFHISKAEILSLQQKKISNIFLPLMLMFPKQVHCHKTGTMIQFSLPGIIISFIFMSLEFANWKGAKYYLHWIVEFLFMRRWTTIEKPMYYSLFWY